MEWNYRKHLKTSYELSYLFYECDQPLNLHSSECIPSPYMKEKLSLFKECNFTRILSNKSNWTLGCVRLHNKLIS